jgi:hypothetical protein
MNFPIPFRRNLLDIVLLLMPIVLCGQITYEPAFSNLRFSTPVEIQNAQDGTNRLFVVEQSGIIKVFENDPNLASDEVAVFLDLQNQVTFSPGQEMGLLGLAFHPNFTQNGWFYVYYTTGSSNNLQMVTSRFSVSNNDINSADPDSEVIFLQYNKNQTNSNHNGGKIAFGTDGHLYISIGDGGGANDPQNNSQNINNPFGSILRIDVDLNGDNPIAPNGTYEIPSDNPFVDTAGLDEIFAYGIRNTWKFSIDPITGRIFGGDVGQGAFEEINLIENNGNYGWKRFEGNAVANSGAAIEGPGVLSFPIFVYNRSQGDRSITGGYVYRGSDITSLNPSIQSQYIFGDYISGRVWALNYDPDNNSASSTLLFQTSNEFISTFGVDENGVLYFSDYGSNAQIYKLVDGTSGSVGISAEGTGDWSQLVNTQLNGEVNALAAIPSGGVFIGGKFNDLSNPDIQNLALWTEANGLEALGKVNGVINAMELDTNGNLYVGGVFSAINGQTLENIAMWDGNNWNALGDGIKGVVSSLQLDSNGNLYAAGIFETVNGSTSRNIAQWNGNNWSPLIDATNAIAGTNNEIRSLALDDEGVLYVGGNFDEAGGLSANRIASWDGSHWSNLGLGTTGFVEAITTNGSIIYVGGNFGEAGGIVVNRIAQWNKDSSSWSAIENGLNNIVNDLIHDGIYLYAAGNFELANRNDGNSIITNRMVRWHPSNGWEPLGNGTAVGVDIKLNTIVFSESDEGSDLIYAGGNFSQAGDISANDIAVWQSDNLLSNSTKSLYLSHFYPNPTSDIIYFKEQYAYKLIDSNGKVLLRGKDTSCPTHHLAKGVYFLILDNHFSHKIVKD